VENITIARGNRKMRAPTRKETFTMKKTGYKVNHETTTISCSQLFLKKASKIGTPEYKALLKARHDFPDYIIEANEPKKTEARMSTKGLTREYAVNTQMLHTFLLCVVA